MPTFKYSAKNPEARTVSGKMVAESQAKVIEELRSRKLTIISVEEVRESGFGKASASKKKVKQ